MEATLTFNRLTNYQEGVSANGAWKRQEALFETRDNYPKTIAMSGFNSMAESLANCQPGAAYDVKFEIASREYNGKWYTDIKVFGIEIHATIPAPAQQQYGQQQYAQQQNGQTQRYPAPAQQQMRFDPLTGEQYQDDLPF